MTDIQPTVLEGRGIRLEPLSTDHGEALATAVADGCLWDLWFVATPEPENIANYIDGR